MFPLLRSFYDTYTIQLFMQLNMGGQLLAAALFLSQRLRRRRYFPAFFLASLLINLGVTLVFVVFRTHHGGLATRFLMRFVQFSMPLLMILLCYRDSWFTKVKVWCASVAAMEIGAACFSFLLALLGIDERGSISLFSQTQVITLADWLIYYALHCLVYWAVYRLAGPGVEDETPLSDNIHLTLALMLSCMVFLTIPDCVSNEFRNESWAMLIVNRIYLFALSVFILVLCNGIELWSQYRAEMKVLEQVFALERKQYHQMKENIEVINMQCHDLKRQLEDFSGKLTQKEICSLQEAMDVYERNIKTGNEALDVILYLSQLTCRKEHIELTCLADGASLGFMASRHVYSLFQNALGNAIEAVSGLEDPEKKVISLTITQREEQVEVELTNYFDGKPLPRTRKEDKNHHGFGTLSMQYILRQYGGTLWVQTQHDIFSLCMRLPKKEVGKRPFASPL